MAKSKAGLHKKVSSIFDGVPIPKESGAEQQINAPTSGHTSDVTVKPATPGLPTAPTPKPQQPVPPPPKAAPPKQPKADATVKTAKQIPWRESWHKIESKFFAPKPGVDVKRQKTMMILIPVLFIILIFVFIRVFSRPSRAVATAAKLGPSEAVAASIHKIDWQIPALYPATLRDPMQFGSVIRHGRTQTGTGRLVVKGIVYSEDKPAVVIGTEIVREGDKVLGATIVKINKNSVEFEMNGKKWTQRVQ